MLKFAVTDADKQTIERIAERAHALYKAQGARCRLIDVLMDLTATHANGCPLRLADLEVADDFNLMHDVSGIARHLDRRTGTLDCFQPRFAV